MKQAVKVVEEIKRLEVAMATSRSQYLRNDYAKNIKKLKRELKEYCFYKGFIYKDVLSEK